VFLGERNENTPFKKQKRNQNRLRSRKQVLKFFPGTIFFEIHVDRHRIDEKFQGLADTLAVNDVYVSILSKPICLEI
jgi:hypothetical protein